MEENPPKVSKRERERPRERYLVASLSLSDQNEGIGADNGEAEVDEDNGALGADVPGDLQKRGGVRLRPRR